jgi:glycosyltransferase involved in cell wall biosynthesis
MALNIVHITSVHQRNDIRIFQKQCRSLQESYVGHVTLLVADGKGDDKESGIKIIDVGIPGRNRFWRMFFGNFRIWKKLRLIKPDIIHLHDPELLILGFLHALLNNIVVYDMHENLPKEILTKTYIHRLLRLPLSFLIKLFQKTAFNLISVVFAEKSYPKDFQNIKKSVIVLNFPLLNEMKNIITSPKNTFNVGYLGGISKERGALMQLQAIYELRKDGFDIETTFIGPCSHEITKSKIYETAISEGWAVFSGRLKPEDAWLMISKCHVGLVVLEPSPNFVESYPTKLFEYMTLGIPCIVSDFPLYRKIINEEQCGLLIDPLNLNDLKEAIKWMFNNRDLARMMGERGRSGVFAKYSWESEFVKLKKFYFDVVKKNNTIIYK